MALDPKVDLKMNSKAKPKQKSGIWKSWQTAKEVATFLLGKSYHSN